MKKTTQNQFLKWFRSNQRPLPWRQTTDPYKIWISETMLQQTTSTAVIPYYEKFVKRFPTVKMLASAPENVVLEHWAGLGYYSRARNLHKAAKNIAANGFPNNHQDLLKLPGFGPYTARAVSSLAFKESVGVLDGNVIRVLSRYLGEKIEWWKTAQRNYLQSVADKAVVGVSSGEMNQALMELGATICLPKNPQCLLCPLIKSCHGLKSGIAQSLPLKKPKRAREIWHWQADLIEKKDFVQIIRNDYAPFLRQQWFLPGKVKQLKAQPKSYDFRHSITHHDIYISVKKSKTRLKTRENSSDMQWVRAREIQKYTPSSLIKKVLQLGR